jgi:hypothetical protein
VPAFVAGLALDDIDVAAIYLQHTSPEGVTNALAPRLTTPSTQGSRTRSASAELEIRVGRGWRHGESAM